MYIEDLALNNLEWLICHKPKLPLTFSSACHYPSHILFCLSPHALSITSVCHPPYFSFLPVITSPFSFQSVTPFSSPPSITTSSFLFGVLFSFFKFLFLSLPPLFLSLSLYLFFFHSFSFSLHTDYMTLLKMNLIVTK